jgi:SAM-dependent methyltransferase
VSTTHYDKRYFDWQRTIGEFGGWANSPRFARHIKPSDVVLDFGCGGGYLLKHFDCRRRLGVEINPTARSTARDNGIEVFASTHEIGDDSVDVVVSNHCLEHVPDPLRALTELRCKLRVGGKAIFVVPCEMSATPYDPTNIDHHLYTWNPTCLGNLFSDAGFRVLSATRDRFRWPPFYRQIAALGGRWAFELACKIWYYLDRRSFQVRLVAERPA